jgi:hypothetical protein
MTLCQNRTSVWNKGIWSSNHFRSSFIFLLSFSCLFNSFWNFLSKSSVSTRHKILPQFLGSPCEFSDPHLSRIVSVNEMETKEAMDILAALGQRVRVHRKQWEFVSIVRALRKANMLQPGKRGLVFAAGSEPLISYFASFGPEIVATDLPLTEAHEKGWVHTKQHANTLDALYRKKTISRKDFDKRVSFMNADMNHINESWFGTFDFLWTTCSVEHIGSIALGQKFARDSMKLLKPNGFAVHTTEFLISSLKDTVKEGSTAYWRLRDVEEMFTNLKTDGHTPSSSMCLKTGNDNPFDYDVLPYSSNNHTRLLVGEWVITSIFWTVTRKP